MLSSTFHTIEHGKTEAYDTAWSKWTQEDAQAARNQATGRGVLFITHFWRSCTIASQAKQCKVKKAPRSEYNTIILYYIIYIYIPSACLLVSRECSSKASPPRSLVFPRCKPCNQFPTRLSTPIPQTSRTAPHVPCSRLLTSFHGRMNTRYCMYCRTRKAICDASSGQGDSRAQVQGSGLCCSSRRAALRASSRCLILFSNLQLVLRKLHSHVLVDLMTACVKDQKKHEAC